MKDKILITGASGFIGYHLAEAAMRAGMDVDAAVRPSSDVSFLRQLETTGELPGVLKLVHIDFSSKTTLQELLAKGQYTGIIHAAGLTKAKTLAAYNLVNATYSLHLAEAALAAQIPLKRFVHLSSLAALGPVQYTENQPITEDAKPGPVTDYGKSKLLAEQYLCQVKGLPLTIIRPTAVYGPGERDLFVLFKTLSKGVDAYIGKNPQRLSFVYVKDLVAATLAALAEQREGIAVYNVSDGNAYDRYALADRFREISGKSVFRAHLPTGIVRLAAGLLDTLYAFSATTPVLNREKLKELTAPNWICSIDAAKNHLGYAPRYDLSTGLAETLQWYRENKWL